MRFFIGITTYQRIDYLKKLVDSFIKYSSSEHEYFVVINDDGSTDGSKQYLNTLQNTKNITWKITHSQNKGSHFTTNKNLYQASLIEFDLGFRLDDDLYFIKKGWEILYYNAYKERNFAHLSHYSTDWSRPNQNGVIYGKLRSFTNVWQSQGAFYTFTKEMINEIGFIDDNTFGRRGEGHRDFSLRACRKGFNDKANFWDANHSDEYIRLHEKKGYITTPNYDNEIRIAKQSQRIKDIKLRDESRTLIKLQSSELNYCFDKIYLLNLKRRPDRLTKMERRLSKLQIDFEVWEAIDGIENKDCLKMNKHNPRFNSGVYGCLFSHLNIMREIKEKGYGSVLILEDDLIPHKRFKTLIRKLKELPEWDLLYLGASDYNDVKTDEPYYKANKVDGTFAYAVKSNIVNEIIKQFESKKLIPVDTKLHNIQSKFRSYVMNPLPFISDVRDSDLREKRDLKEHGKKLNWKVSDYV